MISTKGRYAIRILLDLAEHNNGSYIPMKEVAARQEISLKYIEKIMPSLKSSGLIDSVHGIGGGYRLTRPPEQYTLWEILKLAEGDLAPVSCIQDNAPVCHRAAECRTLSVWQGYYDLTREYFSGITPSTVSPSYKTAAWPGVTARCGASNCIVMLPSLWAIAVAGCSGCR